MLHASLPVVVETYKIRVNAIRHLTLVRYAHTDSPHIGRGTLGCERTIRTLSFGNEPNELPLLHPRSMGAGIGFEPMTFW